MKQQNGKDKLKLVKNERGFSLMEYAIGLVVLVAIGYASMQLFANGMDNFFAGGAQWSTARGGDLSGSLNQTITPPNTNIPPAP